MKKLNRSKLLGMVTAGAIVVTTAFSFAAWDSLEDTATSAVTIDEKITNTASMTTELAGDSARVWGAAIPNYSGEVKFAVANVTDISTAKLTMQAVVTDITDGTANSKYDVVIKEGTTALTGGLDETITTDNTYSVVVTPKDDTVAGHEISVEITGTLSQK